MKKVIFSMIFLLAVSGGLIRCNIGGGGDTAVDPCTDKPNCIPELSNWKLSYKPYNSNCMKCHTTCTPNSEHNFCITGGSWGVTEERCLKCHSTRHQ